MLILGCMYSLGFVIFLNTVLQLCNEEVNTPGLAAFFGRSLAVIFWPVILVTVVIMHLEITSRE